MKNMCMDALVQTCVKRTFSSHFWWDQRLINDGTCVQRIWTFQRPLCGYCSTDSNDVCVCVCVLDKGEDR